MTLIDNPTYFRKFPHVSYMNASTMHVEVLCLMDYIHKCRTIEEVCALCKNSWPQTHGYKNLKSFDHYKNALDSVGSSVPHSLLHNALNYVEFISTKIPLDFKRIQLDGMFQFNLVVRRWAQSTVSYWGHSSSSWFRILSQCLGSMK